jgi:hypothetical protein
MVWDVNWWAVAVSAVAYFVLGAVWYGAIFGNAWMAALSMTREQMSDGGSPAQYALTLILEFFAMSTLAVLLVNSPASGLWEGAAYGALVAGGVWVTLLAVTFTYESRRPSLFLIDAFYHLIAFVVGGAILGFWV